MKKFATLLTVAIFAVSFAACAKKADETTIEEPAPAGEVEVNTAPTPPPPAAEAPAPAPEATPPPPPPSDGTTPPVE